MKIPPPYEITSEMVEIIAKIESYRINFASLNISRQTKDKIQRTSLLKSSLFSARIEGNPLELSEVSFEKTKEINKSSTFFPRSIKLTEKNEERHPRNKLRGFKKVLDKIEIFNIIEASNFIEKVKKGNITKKMFLELHKRVLKNINAEAGFFRNEPSAIFNQAGIAVYIPPSQFEISKLLDKLIKHIKDDNEKFPLVKALIAHLIFEKIHPFLDGNGRVGRLLISLILKAKGWDFSFTIPYEEYLDKNKSDYYYYLDIGLTDTNNYLVFMLNAYLSEIENLKSQIEEESNKDQLFLPPRQEEILNIIKDHGVISFDMIRRRFLKVPERTLRYDLKKLLDKGIIEKSGETKGRFYRVKT